MSTEAKWIFWDFHGTLALLSGGWSGLLAKAAGELSPEKGITAEQVRSVVMGRFPWDKADLAHPKEWKDPAKWWASVETMMALAMMECGLSRERAAKAAIETHREVLNPGNYEVYEDTVETLGVLSEEGYRHALLSNHVPELESIVEGLGLRRYFEFVVTSGQVGYEKPHPEIFKSALAMAGAGTGAWMVGDNPVADHAGALNAGLKPLLVRNPKADVEMKAENLIRAVEIIRSR